MRQLKVAELREGVWLRPGNLPADRSPDAARVVAAQCRWFAVDPDDDPRSLASSLWDLDAWMAIAAHDRVRLRELVGPLEQGDTDAIAEAFVVSAAVLRHLLADPQLPDPLLPADWPGAVLRTEYDRYDAAFKRLWRDWFRTQI
jgi:phenylacetic acid degradation operon negative regulatory protein